MEKCRGEELEKKCCREVLEKSVVEECCGEVFVVKECCAEVL